MKYKHSNVFLILSFLYLFSSFIYFVYFIESLQVKDDFLSVNAGNFITSILSVVLLFILNKMSLKISDLDKKAEELESKLEEYDSKTKK